MEAINRTFLSNDLITITFLIGLVLVFLMKLYKPKVLLGYTLAFFTPGFIEDRSDEDISVFSIFYNLLFLFSVILIAATLFIILSPHYFEKNNTNLVYLVLSTFTYYILKKSITFFILLLFDIKDKLSYLLYAKNGYLYTSCLLLFPVLILNQYATKNNFIVLFFVALLLIFRVFLIFKNNKNLIFNHMFYFILYFCALELAPLLILYKTIN